MANKIYCLKCNQSTSYESSPAKFCSHCGKPYIDTTNANLTKPVQVASRPLKRPVRQIEQEETYDDDDYTAPESIPQIDKFECEIQKDLRPNREHLNSIAAKGEIGIRRPKPKVKGKQIQINEKQASKVLSSVFPKNTTHDTSDGE